MADIASGGHTILLRPKIAFMGLQRNLPRQHFQNLFAPNSRNFFQQNLYQTGVVSGYHLGFEPTQKAPPNRTVLYHPNPASGGCWIVFDDRGHTGITADRKSGQFMALLLREPPHAYGLQLNPDRHREPSEWYWPAHFLTAAW